MNGFETWFNLNGDDIYDNEVEDIARAAWQAATLAEREACASLVEPKIITDSGYCKMKARLAELIRARGDA